MGLIRISSLLLCAVLTLSFADKRQGHGMARRNISFKEAGLGWWNNYVVDHQARAFKVQERQDDTISLYAFGANFGREEDQSEILQKAISTGKVILIDRPLYIRKNIYLYGTARLLGENDGEIILDEDFGKADGRKYVFNCGIRSKRGKNEAWSGWIKNIRFTGTNKAIFNYCIQLHNVDGVRIEKNVFDFSRIPQTSVKADARGCAVEGLNDRAWNAGSMSRNNIIIQQNKVINKQDNVGKEGLGITNAKNVVFDSNYCFGMGDDGIAVHSVENFTISNNKLFLVDGRILMTNSQHGKVYNNYVEKIPMQNEKAGQWTTSESFVRIGWESPQKYALNNSDIKIYNNKFLLSSEYKPPSFGKTSIIKILGAQDCVVENNEIVIQCNEDYISSPIVITHAIKKQHGVPNRILIPENIKIINNNISGNFGIPIDIGKNIDLNKHRIQINSIE